jgi:hypothetical protein
MLNELKSLQDRAELRRSQAASARRLAPELPQDEEMRILAYADDLDREAERLARHAHRLQARGQLRAPRSAAGARTPPRRAHPCR